MSAFRFSVTATLTACDDTTCIIQGPYTSGHLKFKAIQDFSRLFEKDIQDCFNDICTFNCSKLTLKTSIQMNHISLDQLILLN